MRPVLPPRHFALLAAALSLACSGCPAAPEPKPGVAAGTSCTTDLACADGLVCACGVCAAPGAANEPPRCDTLPAACTPFPTACVQSCDAQVFVGMAVCVDAEEVCDVGLLASACPLCVAPLPAGYVCSNGDAVCAVAAVTGCSTTGCTEPTFSCVLSCADGAASFTSSCVDGAQACDAVDAVPAASCAPPDAGTEPDAGSDAGSDADAGDPPDAGSDAGD